MAKSKLDPAFFAQLKAFDSALDQRLAACAIQRMDADEALAMLMNLSASMAAHDPMVNGIDKAIEVFAPRLVSGTTGDKVDMDRIINDVEFGTHYYLLREYLYYAFNFPGAFTWTEANGVTDIRFLDRSIPRQFNVSLNESVVGAREHFADTSRQDALKALIKGRDEWTGFDEQFDSLLKAEVDHKLLAYFAVLPPDSPADFGGYTYAQFYQFYRILAAKALWHRWHAEVNGTGGALTIAQDELIEAGQQDTGIDRSTLELILRDLVYDKQAESEGLSPGYFSLMREGGTGRIWMRPMHFSLHEGVVGLMRVAAHRRNDQFLNHVSNPLGANFVQRMAGAFRAEEFECLTEVKLTQYDQTLPDIDLMVISHEPTLGYVILVCECKCPIPATWSKDHLRALNRDSVSKAFGQCQRIGEFLTSENGLGVLRELLPQQGLENFDHFVVVLQPLVITSHNGGMFFDAMRTPVFAYQTIERMLKACDGDISYIQHMLRVFNETFDADLSVANRSTNLLHGQVSYDTVDFKATIQFPPNRWRSDSTLEEVVRDFVESGGQPIDSFASASKEAVAGSADQTPSPELGRPKVILFDFNEERRGHYIKMPADSRKRSKADA